MIHFLIGFLFGALPFVLYLTFSGGGGDTKYRGGGSGPSGSDPNKIRD